MRLPKIKTRSPIRSGIEPLDMFFDLLVMVGSLIWFLICLIFVPLFNLIFTLISGAENKNTNVYKDYNE